MFNSRHISHSAMGKAPEFFDHHSTLFHHDVQQQSQHDRESYNQHQTRLSLEKNKNGTQMEE